MKTIANATAKDIQNKVKEWNEMTANNEHSDLLCDMACFFEMGDDLITYFFDLGSKNYLTLDECEERYSKREQMLSAIKAQYGENIYNQIMKSF